MNKAPLAIDEHFLKRITPGQCAVLVIDMQNDFCAADGYVEKVVGKDASSCRRAAPHIDELVFKARQSSVPVIWVRADYTPEKIAPVMRAKQVQLSEATCCAEGSLGAEFYHVSPEPGEQIVTKHNYSAFIDTGLAAQLRQRGIKTLIFAGVQTNVCVEQSVRDAFCMGFACVVAEDCVASHTQNLHDATLMNIRFLYGDVVSKYNIISAWSIEEIK